MCHFHDSCKSRMVYIQINFLGNEYNLVCDLILILKPSLPTQNHKEILISVLTFQQIMYFNHEIGLNQEDMHLWVYPKYWIWISSLMNLNFGCYCRFWIIFL